MKRYPTEKPSISKRGTVRADDCNRPWCANLSVGRTGFQGPWRGNRGRGFFSESSQSSVTGKRRGIGGGPVSVSRPVCIRSGRTTNSHAHGRERVFEGALPPAVDGRARRHRSWETNLLTRPPCSRNRLPFSSFPRHVVPDPDPVLNK